MWQICGGSGSISLPFQIPKPIGDQPGGKPVLLSGECLIQSSKNILRHNHPKSVFLVSQHSLTVSTPHGPLHAKTGHGDTRAKVREVPIGEGESYP